MTDDFPMPGDEWDGGTTVASGWVDDYHIGVLLLRAEGPYYEVAEYRLAGHNWEQAWGETHANVVPAARQFDACFNFWGEDQ